MSKLALAIIAKDDSEAADLERCLESYKPYVDGIFVTGNHRPQKEIRALCDRFGAHWSYKEWGNDFADMRNYNWSQVPTDQYQYITWADCDDELVGGEHVRQVIVDMEAREINWAMCLYDYDRNDQNVGTGDHWKPRIIKHDGKNVWKKGVHENLEYEGRYIAEFYQDVKVKHHFDVAKHHAKELRNYEILLAEYKRDGANTDPRTLHYLGKSSYGLAVSPGNEAENAAELLEQAINFLEMHIHKSGWDEEIYFSYCFMGLAFNHLDQTDAAERAFVAATLVKPGWADAYWYLCLLHFDKDDFAKAAEWGEVAYTKSVPKTVLSISQELYTSVGPAMLARAYVATNQIKKAQAVAASLKDPDVQNLVQDAHDLDDYVQCMIRGIAHTARFDKRNLDRFVNGLPDVVMEDGRLQELVMLAREPKKWPAKSIAFYCGRSLEDWADPSVMTGIGGSEEATVHVTRELVKLGYDVTVFNQCGKYKGVYNGVKYRPYWEYSPKDYFDWLIIWREPSLALTAMNAKKVWVLLHDRPFPDWFNQSILDRIDKLVLLSDYQRTCVPDIPDDKILVSSNALYTPDILTALESTPRNPHQIIWSSSYDRGLDHLLARWPEIRAAVPGATLRIFYGWENFDISRGHDPDAVAWKASVVEAMKQPGVYHGGRIGQAQLAREFAASSLWVYPTAFWEISCITAMRAQALGAVPICTDYAALDQTVQHGFKVPGVTEFGVVPKEVMDQVVELTIKALKDPKAIEGPREAMMKWAQEHYSWVRVAKEWADEDS